MSPNMSRTAKLERTTGRIVETSESHTQYKLQRSASSWLPLHYGTAFWETIRPTYPPDRGPNLMTCLPPIPPAVLPQSAPVSVWEHYTTANLQAHERLGIAPALAVQLLQPDLQHPQPAAKERRKPPILPLHPPPPSMFWQANSRCPFSDASPTHCSLLATGNIR